MDILFIIFLLFACGLAIVAAEADNFIFTTATMLSTFIVLDVFFAVPIWATILSNPLTIIMFVFAYTLVGAAYTAMWRWPESLQERASEIQEQYARWTKMNETLTKQDFMNSYEYSKYSASYNYDKLANWVLAWPFSLAWELARKPAIWLWNTSYEILGTLFDRIAKRVITKILKDK
jgi:predicted membrane protein